MLQNFYSGYVKNFRRHFKARNLNGSVVLCTCARASAWIGVSSKFSIFIGSQQYLRAVIKTSANNILPGGATQFYFFSRKKEKDLFYGKNITSEGTSIEGKLLWQNVRTVSKSVELDSLPLPGESVPSNLSVQKMVFINKCHFFLNIFSVKTISLFWIKNIRFPKKYIILELKKNILQFSKRDEI